MFLKNFLLLNTVPNRFQIVREGCRDTFVMGKSDMSKCPIIKWIYNRVYTIVIEVLDLI